MSEPGKAQRQPLTRLIGRALRRRCPQCGNASAFVGFWKLAPHCAACGHTFERESGYWVGAVIFNTALAILAFLLTFALVLLTTWPEVPWDLLAPIAIGVTILLPVLSYPWAQTTWMAYDLFVHPLEPEELVAAEARLKNSPPTTHRS
ncbi:MAG: DUF983 domain-containing protein [Acidimicrobiia bacterium]